MKLKNFRIQNYKSITDSGYCTFASDLTILIGKNESGKTATLEALKYFNKNTLRVSEDVFPLDGSTREPLVEICFQLSREEIDEIQETSGVKLAARALDFLLQDGLTVTKDGRGRYSLSEKCIEQLFNYDISKEPVEYIKSAKENLNRLLNAPRFPSIDYESSNENIQKETKEFIRVVKSYLPSVRNEETQMEAVKTIRDIVKESVKLTEPLLPQQPADNANKEQKMNSVAFFTERFVESMPNFVFFSEFSDILPFEIPIANLKSNQAVLDFAKIAGLDLDYLMETNDIQKRINFLNKYSTHISGNFHGYWNQNCVELAVRSEGDKLVFGIQEEGKTDFFKVAQRSKGFQWFLSFYLRINAQKSGNNFIIIDEPGVHLHAKAQRQILKVLEEEIVTDAQVIFSTHCSYIIDPERLDRIRVVLKDEKTGTFISDDIHNQAYEESIVPVITAMGGEQTNVAPLAKKQNVIVGGVHDFYFLRALKSYMPRPKLEDIHLLPATDIGKIEQLVSLMAGYDLDFLVLLNHDNDSWKIAQQLKTKFGFGDEKIIFVSEQPGFLTEDLFTLEDFNSHVLNREADEGAAVLNSVHMKNHSMNKVLLAKEFFKRVEKQRDDIALSDQTIASFRSVFEKIFNKFHALNEADQEREPEEPEVFLNGGKKRRSLFAFLKKK